MREVFNRVAKNPLISGSIIVFAGSIFANLFNFLFNLFMSRNLTLTDYGILASLISIISLFGFAATAVVPTVVRFAGPYFAKGDLPSIRGLFISISKILFLVGGISFAVFFLFRENIGQFFKIDNEFFIILVGLNIFLGFISVINQALLQAKLDFAFFSITIFVGAFFKFCVGVLLVLAGYAVGGGIWAFFVAGLIPYILTFFRLPFLFQSEVKKRTIAFAKVFKYGSHATLAVLGITSFISTDIILVKHFFDPVEAGIYATLSLVGRVIFFLSSPIGTVMFPLIIHKNSKRESFHSIFKLSLLLVFAASSLITIFYFIFPEFILQFFSKKTEIAFAVPFVGIFGIYITIYSMLALCTNFYLSIKKTKVYIPVLFGAILQATLIWFYHETFLQVILISLSIASLLLILLLIYYFKLYGNKTA